ncbi:MAG: RrF2 family transcriptional regulator [Armatimonadota bacterium]
MPRKRQPSGREAATTKLSAKSDYGLRAAVELAGNYGAGPIQAREIAERQEVPLRFLEQLLGDLKRAGLVESTRGALGGYALARRPDRISAWDVVVALESEIALAERPADGDVGPGAAVSELLLRAQEELTQVLKGVSLRELLARQQALEAQAGPMFHI